jgi:hypothetical protein
VRQVAQEDFDLCVVAQENLERGVYSQGVLNRVKESGVLRKCSPPFFWFSVCVCFLLLDNTVLGRGSICACVCGLLG